MRLGYTLTRESKGACNSCPGLLLVTQNKVFVGGKAAARSVDNLTCCGVKASTGSSRVFIVGAKAHRVGDQHPCGGKQIKGMYVQIG